jgi:hypothetical protein
MNGWLADVFCERHKIVENKVGNLRILNMQNYGISLSFGWEATEDVPQSGA